MGRGSRGGGITQQGGGTPPSSTTHCQPLLALFSRDHSCHMWVSVSQHPWVAEEEPQPALEAPYPTLAFWR